MRTLGIERERFIVKDGRIVPAIGAILPRLKKTAKKNAFSKHTFTYELFAGQVEDRTRVVTSMSDVIQSLLENDNILNQVGRELGFSYLCTDYVSEEEIGDLAVNPFSERHQRIWSQLPYERKLAASQVAAIHVHVGVKQREAAEVLNSITPEICRDLVTLGDFSEGRRIASYRKVCGNFGLPPKFASPQDLMAYIAAKGGEREVWDLVRFKPTTQTVEFRMFGSTANYETIKTMVITCLGLIP